MAKRKKVVQRAVYPKALEKIVEKERGHLANALAILQCMNLAMDAHGVPSNGPFWPDLVDVAMEKIKHAFNGLDLVNIHARLEGKPRPVATVADRAFD